MAKHKVLSTKKLEPSLLELAKENGIEIVEKEFISIKPVWNEETFKKILSLIKSGKLNAVFTSANAVDVLNSYLVHDTYYIANWNIFCLSGKTKKAILSARFLEKNIVAEANTASALAEHIIQKGITEIIFFCGNKRRDELPAMLKRANISIHEVILYETLETPEVIDNGFDAVLFFSPSAVQSFFSANELKEHTVCFAIGPTTANSIATFTQNQIAGSLIADQHMLVEEVIEHFKLQSTKK